MAVKSNKDLNLLPPLVDHGRVYEFVKSGQTVSTTLSPLDNSLAVFVTSSDNAPFTDLRSIRNFTHEQPVYFASWDVAPRSERRLFITDTLVIFAAFQNLLKTSGFRDSNWAQTDQHLATIRKLAIDYVNFIRECWVHASQPITRSEPLQFDSGHYRSLYTCFSLFVVLYLPEPDYEDTPVGDELLEWLNIHFIEPSTEEGDHLSALESPWEDDTFWPYLTRAILRGLTKSSEFFLHVLSRHPSVYLQNITKELIPLIGSQPRLHNFSAERDFAQAARRWQNMVKTLRIEMDKVPEAERQDDFDNWWDRFSDIVGILEGRGSVVQRVCAELGADWKEVCAAWGVFVDTKLRRQDLPAIAAQVLEDMPPDPTNLEDLIHVNLISDNLKQALVHSSQLDPWLSAHMADIMDPLSLVDPTSEDISELSLRDQYILSYSDYLRSDPGLWRITIEYMYSCGDIGKAQADQVLIRVPLRMHDRSETFSNEMGLLNAGEITGVVKEVSEACLEYEREAVRRTVCQIAARQLVREKEFALALSYYTSAEDWAGVGHTANRILQECVVSGPETFVRCARDLAPSVDILAGKGVPGVFLYRLQFATRYARFHQLRLDQNIQEATLELVDMLQQDMVPQSWIAVLLCDVADLTCDAIIPLSGALIVLRKVEEVFTRVGQGIGDDYMAILSKLDKTNGEVEALNRLKCVRLVMAKYIARCYMLDENSAT